MDLITYLCCPASGLMDYGENLNEPVLHFASDEDVPLKQKWKLMPAPAAVPENMNGCLDCNICLDSAQEPVVTLCGHLYCWPCIYKWLQVQSSSHGSDEQPKCPVCKAYITNSTLVPLYGRGTSSKSEAKRPQLDFEIPRRPQALGLNTLLPAGTSVTSQPNQQLPPNPFQPQPGPFHHQQYFPLGSYASMVPSNLGGTTMTSFYSPAVWMFGEMVYARLFGSDTNLFAYPYQNSYPLSGSGNPRMRRQEMQVDKSLNRVSIFLFCCIILCLLLF